MKWGRWALLVLATLAATVATVRWTLRAQDQARPGRSIPVARRLVSPPVASPDRADGQAPMSVQDALLRPVDLPFVEPTSLADVQKHLAKTLEAPVVLDLSALARLEIDSEDTVQLDLKGVRLKTGLKLLLDQVGMTFRVEPEDNLLILTDAVEGGEPVDRALHELKALHKEMHDLQDAVDDLRDLVEQEFGADPVIDPTAPVFVRSGSDRLTRRFDSHRRRPRPFKVRHPDQPGAGARG